MGQLSPQEDMSMAQLPEPVRRTLFGEGVSADVIRLRQRHVGPVTSAAGTAPSAPSLVRRAATLVRGGCRPGTSAMGVRDGRPTAGSGTDCRRSARSVGDSAERVRTSSLGAPGRLRAVSPECGSQGRQPAPVPSTQHLLPPQTFQREHQEKPSVSHRQGVSETPNPSGSKNRVHPWVLRRERHGTAGLSGGVLETPAPAEAGAKDDPERHP